MPLALKTDADFRRAPRDGFVFGEGWIYFCIGGAEDVYGFSVWGGPTPEGIGALVRLLELELDRPPHAALVDARAVAWIAAPPFADLLGYVARHYEALSRIVTRVAIVRGEGLSGAAVTGFLDVASSPFPATYFVDPVAALTALGVADPADAADALDAAQQLADGIPVILRALGTYLEGHLLDATIDHAARALSLSTRTLQRRLGEASTSFVHALQEARVRVARRLLAETSDSLTSIAADIGCASPQHFSVLFRKHVGVTPSAYRSTLARR